MPKTLYQNIRQAILEAKQKVVVTVNTVMVETYWQIGKYIIEEEQQGNTRAEYGKKLLASLAQQLTEEFGKGYTATNLKYMRQFYLAFPIRHAVSDESFWTHPTLCF
jgi:hypothetical protein